MKNIIILLFALLPLLCFGQGTPISGYPAASTLQGDEVFPGLQPGTGGPGTTRKISINQVRTFVITGLTKSDVGLGNVDNTSDLNKPISTLTQTALDLKGSILYIDAQDAGRQPIDGDLTAIGGLSPSNDDIIQRKSGAWTNRTIAQLKTDLALITQTITNGVTTTAPSEDAVFDADALKQDKSKLFLEWALSNESTPITATTLLTDRAPYAFTITGVRASLTTAQSSGSTFTLDIREDGVTIFSTLITFDNTEKTTTTATAAVLSDTSIADDAELTFVVTQVGNGTATGLKVRLYVTY